MAPKKSLNLATSDGEEERHHQLRRFHVKSSSNEHRLDGCVTMKKKKKMVTDIVKKKMVTDIVKKKKKTKKLKLEMEEEEANKSLFVCSLEYHEGKRVSYVVRTIKLSDLFSSSNSELRQVAYEAGDHLPGSVGCGVMGSRIIFSGGLKPSVRIASIGPESVWHTDVYAFETDPNKQQPCDNTRIRKMDATLLQAKFSPLTVEIAGKLYALSYKRVSNPPSFEVFDPNIGKWSALPQPPFLQLGSRYWVDAPLSYAIAGTKMFASHQKCPVFCFDVAHPNREWRLVPTMCGGGPFPFSHKSLVLDHPEDGKKKIMFAYSHEYPRCLRVYLMSLDENQESITPITGGFKLPKWPYEFGLAAACDIVHIGGQKACFLITQFDVPHEHRPKYEPGTHKTRGVAIPFQFQVDITKVDKDKKNCFTLQFMPLCIFEYHTNSSSLPTPGSVGCFVL